MDYLAFGLLAGSLIVIASFVVRDALPHLTAIDGDSRLGRLSRAGSPSAWNRWCADAGLLLAAAGTLVLLITATALLADLSDDVGSMVVGASVVAALVGSTFGVVRLWKRVLGHRERELSGEVSAVAAAPGRTDEMSVVSTASLVSTVSLVSTGSVVAATPPAATEQRGLDLQPEMERPVAAPRDLWDEELPVWSPVTAQAHDHARTTLAEVTPTSEVSSVTVDEPRGQPWTAMIADDAPPRTPQANRGLFSSPLLADIALSPDDEVDDGFRSPLLIDLHDESLDESDGEGLDRDTGSDLLIDETPVTIAPIGRHRDGVDDR